jgi:DNA mismatch repair protein MutL
MPIRLLSQQVASQIAAGEVIERPASVVKELVENALDAGAAQINIKVEDGGRTLIEVSDDGCGIPLNELPLAVARHATSKLDSAEDLYNIQSLGFRGEALASIASIARLTIISAAGSAQTGGRLYVDNSVVQPVEQVGVPMGTVIRVEDLFFNIPARLKFLKKDVTEKRRIDDLVTRYALANPSVRFHLFQNDRPVLQTSGQGDYREVLAALYGPQTARQMLEIHLEQEDMQVKGFISPIDLTRSNRREITFFVNGRWVQDSSLIAAILQAYHNLLIVGRYPMAVLFVKIHPAKVDVNVHPTKAEIRFSQPDQVFTIVQRAVRRGLLAHTPAPGDSSLSNDQHFRPSSQPPIPAWGQVPEHLRAAAPTAAIHPLPQQPSMLPESGQALMRIVGQVGNAYLVAEAPDGLYLVDQHRAHARILFDQLLENQTSDQASVELESPITLHLQPDESTRLGELLEDLSKLGILIEAFGPETYRIRSIPQTLNECDPEKLVRALLSIEPESGAKMPERDAWEQLAADISMISAIPTGIALDMETQQALLANLQSSHSPRTGPYGRPTMIHLSVDLLAHQFGRSAR